LQWLLSCYSLVVDLFTEIAEMPGSGPCLGVCVSKESLGRCLRIMDELIKSLENHGFTVSLSKDHSWWTSAMVLGEEIKFMIKEG
jgi:hypothetical protein